MTAPTTPSTTTPRRRATTRRRRSSPGSARWPFSPRIWDHSRGASAPRLHGDRVLEARLVLDQREHRILAIAELAAPHVAEAVSGQRLAERGLVPHPQMR